MIKRDGSMGRVRSFGRHAALAMSGAMISGHPLAVRAQVPTEDSAIVVTGSRIVRAEMAAASPLITLDRQEIEFRQSNTAEELLRGMPFVRPSLGSMVNNGGDGSSGVNLRGVGDNRTLVLIDGRRVVPFGLDGVVDLNAVPLALIERVDVVTGGVSSVYGADAVAGVVNFVTKRDFTGIDLSAAVRVAQRGDAGQRRVDLLLGRALHDGRGNVVLGLGYLRRDALPITERTIGAFPISSSTGLYAGSTAAVPATFALPGNAALGLASSPFGAVIDPATGFLRAATATDTYNLHHNAYYQTPLQRFNVYGAARYAFSDAAEFYSTAMVTRNEARIRLAASATIGNFYSLPLSNPYLPAGARGQICSANRLTSAQCGAAATATVPGSAGYREVAVIAQRRLVEAGPRSTIVDSTLFQLQAGLRGAIAPSLRYDVSVQHGETAQHQLRENWGSSSKVQQALRAYRDPATGAIGCIDPRNGCVALDLFGRPGSVTPDMAGFIDLDARVRRRVTLSVATAALTGDLPVVSPLAQTAPGFALGAEYRRIGARGRPDAASQIQGEVLGSGARTPPDSGRYDAREIFGELVVPLVEGLPLIRSLTAEAGVRRSDYSTTGANTTWKAGASWEIVGGVRLRGMYQRAVRSPNILELFQSPVQGLGALAADPCQGAAPVADAALGALCVATGAPAAAIGSIPAPPGVVNVTTSGNRQLDVERASTYTLGATLAPALLPGLSLNLDYFNIRIADAVIGAAQGDILSGCYSAALNPARSYNEFCRLIGRNPLNGGLNGGGETPGLIQTGSNLGRIETAGIDLGLDYRLDLSRIDGRAAGSLNIAITGTWLDHFHFQSTRNAINRDCTGVYSTNCTNPRPEYKWNVRTTYTTGRFDLSLLWTHISAVRLEPSRAAPLQPLSTPQPGGPDPATVLDAFERIGAQDYLDLSIGFAVGDRLSFRLTIDNLLDRVPPLVGSGVAGTAFNNGNTLPTTYDVLGRTFTLSAGVGF